MGTGSAEFYRRKGVPSVRKQDLMARTVAAANARIWRELESGARLGPEALMERLRSLTGQRGDEAGRLREALNRQLADETRRLLEDLLRGGGTEFRHRMASLSLPAQEVFGERLAGIREVYLDEALERVRGEQDDLRRTFLEKLEEWVSTGRAVDLNEAVRRLHEEGDRHARFFARDQFSKLNRAVMVESYRQAEAPYVEWLTSNDARVRPAGGAKSGPGEYLGMPLHDHRVRDGKVYTMVELLADPEYKSYGCRCGLRPLWTLTPAQQARRVA